MKKWNILHKVKSQKSKVKNESQKSKVEIDNLIKILLENRGIKTKKEKEEFLNPKLENVTAESVGIDLKELQKAIKRIKEAISKKEQIVVFGDYDVDGICGAAIIWEALYSIGANAIPYIPHRIDEGYGLSLKGISNIKSQMPNIKLIITVDNGIVANEPVEFAKKEGIDVIITDHHLPGKKLPKAHSIVHTTKICGAAVGYLLSKEISNIKYQISNKYQLQNSKVQKNKEILRFAQNDKRASQNDIKDNHLELVALATVADMVPLTSANRTFVKFGLIELRKTKRVGLLELFKEAIIDPKTLDVYQIGHVIAPRLNAMGRLEYAMDSLRLLCTKDKNRAKKLADILGQTNRERQDLTLETVAHAKSSVNVKQMKKILFIVHETYEQGVIGLVAGRLVEEFYRPAIVISKGEKHSKASARSVHGFNIIEFIRSASEFLVEAGGHPMAAGFTVETEKIELLQKKLEDLAETLLDSDKLTRVLKVDCELDLVNVTQELYDEIQKLSPFGMGNPEPTFVAKNVQIEDSRLVGRDGKHLKINFKFPISNIKFQMIEGIGFGLGEGSKIKAGDKIDIAYTIDENEWNRRSTLQLKIKDIKKT